MKLVFIGESTSGELKWGSPYNEGRLKDYLRKHEGRKIRITIEPYSGNLTDEQRRYFEGPIVGAVAQHQQMSEEDTRELLKLEFNPRYISRFDGKIARVPLSTTNLNKLEFSQFIDRITQWMMENGVPVPDPEEYWKWTAEGE